MGDVVIASAVRTPTGRLMGSLSALPAPELFSRVIIEALKSAGLRPSDVDEVIMGNVLSAGLGQNPARQAAVAGGIPYGASALTVNMVCASGLRAVALGAGAIRLGEADVVIAGGSESMSNAPYLVKEMRRGKRLGDATLVDSLVHDALWDCYYDSHMGSLCELAVKKYKITREEQDRFALDSHRKAQGAVERGDFKDEIVPISVGDGVIKDDETIRKETNLKTLARLKTVFKKDGTITAGNAPGLNDGAACLLLMSAKKAKELKIKPLAVIVGYASAHVDPKWYTIAPVRSVKALLKKTDLKIKDFDLIEENEAFAAQTIAVIKELKLDPQKVNVNGGALALGHPIGASGARILVTLVHALKKRKKRLGLATICLGGGGSVSMAVRRT